MKDAAARFWAWFRGEEAALAAHVRANCAPGNRMDAPTPTLLTSELGARVRAVCDGLAPELALGRDGACVLTFTAGGVLERFDDAFDLVDGSPYIPGWEFHALRGRNAPQRFSACGVSFDLADLRFYYRLANDRAVVALLAEDAPECDYRTRREYAAALVSELLGEEDYGRLISDVLLLEYETWLAATPGGRSAPLAIIAPTFDRVFRKPPSRRRTSSPPARLRLVS